MKNLIKYSFIIASMVTMMASCNNKNYVNTTEVYKDGSCYKTMSLKGDSSIATEQVFPVLIDTSWKRKFEIVNKDDKSYELKVSKTFKNVNDLNNQKPNDSVNWSKLDHSYSLDKKFRWFYSYLTYKEEFKKSNPFDVIPVTDYISRDELLVLTGEYTEYLAGRDSAEIEKIRDQIMRKAFTWIQTSIYKEFINTLAENVHQIGNPAIKPETVKAGSDTILTYLKLKEEDISDVLFDIDSMLQICKICLNAPEFEKLSPSKSPVFNDYLEKGKKIDLLFNMMTDNSTNSVTMPGLLIATNCKTVIGNEIRWEYSPIKSFFNNYEISVTSRNINIWAFVVSGFFLIIIIFGLVAGALVKRRR